MEMRIREIEAAIRKPGRIEKVFAVETLCVNLARMKYSWQLEAVFEFATDAEYFQSVVTYETDNVRIRVLTTKKELMSALSAIKKQM